VEERYQVSEDNIDSGQSFLLYTRLWRLFANPDRWLYELNGNKETNPLLLPINRRAANLRTRSDPFRVQCDDAIQNIAL
jgi:hypothetical protein